MLPVFYCILFSVETGFMTEMLSFHIKSNIYVLDYIYSKLYLIC